MNHLHDDGALFRITVSEHVRLASRSALQLQPTNIQSQNHFRETPLSGTLFRHHGTPQSF